MVIEAERGTKGKEEVQGRQKEATIGKSHGVKWTRFFSLRWRAKSESKKEEEMKSFLSDVSAISLQR